MTRLSEYRIVLEIQSVDITLRESAFCVGWRNEFGWQESGWLMVVLVNFKFKFS
jgi:hypothetical protein